MTNATPATASECLQRLRAPDAEIRLQAAYELRKLGEATPAVIAGLLAALSDESGDVQSAAGWALNEFDPAGAAAIPEHVRLLDHPAPRTRSMAVDALGKFGAAATAAVPRLIPLLQDEDGYVSRVFDALRKIGPGPEAVPLLLSILERGGASAIEVAGRLLGKMGGCDAQAVPILVDRLGREPNNRRDVVCGLGQFPLAIETVLIPMLYDDDLEVRAYAAIGIGAADEPGPKVVAEVIRLLEDPVRDVRACAVGAVARFPSSRAKTAAAPRLTVMLRDEVDEYIRSDVAESLGSIGSDAASVVPDLVDLLRDPAIEVRSEAAYVLSLVGPAPDAAIPLLTRLLAEHSARSHAIRALGCCGAAAADAVPDLILLLRGADEGLRMTLVETLGKIGPAAAAAAPELVDLIRRDDDCWLRLYAVQALGRIGPAGVDGLVLAIDDDSLQGIAVEALGRIGPAAAAAIPSLAKLLELKQIVTPVLSLNRKVDVAAVLKELGWKDERTGEVSPAPSR